MTIHFCVVKFYTKLAVLPFRTFSLLDVSTVETVYWKSDEHRTLVFLSQFEFA